MQMVRLPHIIKPIKKCYIILLLLTMYISGCKTDDYTIDLKKIAQLLFQDVQRVEMIITSSKIKTLNNQEINILRSCVRNGMELTEISDKDAPNFASENFIAFVVTWKDNCSTNIFYDQINHYMYIYKGQVRFRDKTKYNNLTVEMYNKIMLGIFKFRPSSLIEKLLYSFC